jgi:hypothetical protein
MQRNVSQLFVIAASLAFNASAAVVVRYTFEEGQNGLAAVGAVTDSSGNAFHGMPINRPVYTAANQPNSSLGLRFSGSQRVVVAHRPQLALHKSFTIEASIFVESCPVADRPYQIVFQGDDRPGNDPIALGVDDTCRVRLLVTDNATGIGANITSRTVLQVRTWYRIQALLDDSADVLALSLNGVEEARAVTRVRADRALDLTRNAALVIGATSTGTQSFVGIIDDVLIRNDAAAAGVPRLTRTVNGASFTEGFTASSWVTLSGSDFSTVSREWSIAHFL